MPKQQRQAQQIVSETDGEQEKEENKGRKRALLLVHFDLYFVFFFLFLCVLLCVSEMDDGKKNEREIFMDPMDFDLKKALKTQWIVLCCHRRIHILKQISMLLFVLIYFLLSLI